MEDFTQLNNLASSSNFAKICFATDDFFAPAENLLNDAEPLWIGDKFTEFGKWMDGWETRRKRIPGHDWCIIKLAAPCEIKGIEADTAYFTGNYVPQISVQAAFLTSEDEKLFPVREKDKMGTACTSDELKQVNKLRSDTWLEIVERSKLSPGYEDTRKSLFPVNCSKIFTHVRLNYFPDGGVARFKVFGIVKVDPQSFKGSEMVDLISLLNGGLCLKYSNAHYGHPGNLIKPSKGFNMGDGWETARRLDRPAILTANENGILNNVPGCEWCIFKVGLKGRIDHVVIDTRHFKGNFPDSVRIEGTQDLENAKWEEILAEFKLSAHKEHLVTQEKLKSHGPFTHVRVTIAPDGGISRVRIFGRPV
ncbi:allantoicase-like [Culicoides brevitarsis]|uniref:allantoicase-like n=1 Tax=Culicoides brevitarsis TaxID=469753 RepID=UPI00307B4F55